MGEMDNFGFRVMLGMLSGNKETVETFRAAKGKVITALELVDEQLLFTFQDGSKMKMFDDGQSCCESRYMTTDDTLSSFIGSTLLDAEIREAPNVEDEGGDHEVQFLLITTSVGVFTMETHNEHNGYYGGFWVVCAPA